MASHVTSFLADLESVRKVLGRVKGKQVQADTVRAKMRQLAEGFFQDVRPQIVHPSNGGEHLDAVNSAMEQLIELSHKKPSVERCKEILRTAKRSLIHLDSRLASTPPQVERATRTTADTRIVTTLRALLPSAALSYEQALYDLDQDERLSWRGPATDLREALREVLDHLAPDNDVKGTSGFKLEPNAIGPTMKQKVRYILRQRQLGASITATAEDATSAIEDAMGKFVRSVYTRSSVSTHTPTDKDEVLRVLDLVRVVLNELLELRVDSN